MSEYETLDAIGGMLDREGGEPTVWTCRYCIRYAATESEIEHRKRCPVGRLVVSDTRIAALEAALRAVAIGENLDEDEASPERYCWCPFGWQGDHVSYCLQARAALADTKEGD